jgi:[acyl-carrier-protein] S-malonyltransferase
VSKIALLFPGQGAQQLGMGRGLVERFPEAKSYFDRASAVLGYDLFELCLNGPEDKLNATNHSQPALFVHSVASLASLLASKPDLMDSVVHVAGLSLGEYSALAAAGVVSFEDGVRLVQERGLAMQSAAEAVPSGMASVIGFSVEQVQELCDKARLDNEILQVANLLCPGNIAISGHVASLQKAESVAAEMGATRFIRLSVAGAFHTAIMNSASERLKQALKNVEMKDASVGLISNVDASNHTEPADFRDLLSRQLVSPVRWEDSLRAMLASGVDQFYEIGSGRVLAGTLKRVDRKAACECVGD